MSSPLIPSSDPLPTVNDAPAAAEPGQGVPSADGFGVHAEDSDVVDE